MKEPNLETIARMTNLGESGQDKFVADWAIMAQNTLYEQGISRAYLESGEASYIIAKAVTDLIDDGEFSTTTLSIVNTLRVNHPHEEDETDVPTSENK
jgi:hypothetical protein